MVAKIRVLAGDFYAGDHAFGFGSFSLVSDRGRETIALGRLRSAEIAGEQNVKRFMSSAGMGIIGGLALGPIGILAGVLSGGNRRQTTFVATFEDDRQILAETDGATFAKFRAATFRTQEQQQPQRPTQTPARRFPVPDGNDARTVWNRFAPELHGHLNFRERGQIDEMILRNEASQLDWFCTKLIRDQCGEAASDILRRCAHG